MSAEPTSREEQAIAAVRWVMGFFSRPFSRVSIPGVDQFLFTCSECADSPRAFPELKDKKAEQKVDLTVYDTAWARKLNPIQLTLSSDRTKIAMRSDLHPAGETDNFFLRPGITRRLQGIVFLDVSGLACTGSVTGDGAAIMLALAEHAVHVAQRNSYASAGNDLRSWHQAIRETGRDGC